MIYDRLGRAAVRFAVAYLRRRYRREIRVGIGVGAGVLAVLNRPPRGLATFLARYPFPAGTAGYAG